MAYTQTCTMLVAVLLIVHSVLVSASNCPSKPESLPELIVLAVPNTNCIDDYDNYSKCDIVLKMEPNSENDSFVDFYLEGNLKGWVAVGFSMNTIMVLTDVVGCRQFDDGSLDVINSWNPDVTPKHNVLDLTQDYMCNYSMKYEDNRLKCHFSRYSGIINNGYDYNLNGSYHIVLGHSKNQAKAPTDPFPYHTVKPTIFLAEFNVYNYNENTSNDTSELPSWNINLKKAHGIIMIIAWSVLASTGIYISTWMRQAFVKGRWFQLHRGLMISVVPAVLIGLICIFISNKDNGIIIGFDCSLQTVHFSFGVISTVLLLVNPIIALLRCKPNSPNRWIFKLIHGNLGVIANILGHVSIGTGLEYYQRGCDQCSIQNALIFFIYLVWQIGFVAVSTIVLNIVFSIIAFKSQGKERYILAPSIIRPCLKMPLTPSSGEYVQFNNNLNGIYDPDKPSKDHVLRTVLFGINTIVNCIVTLLLIGLISTTPPWDCKE